MRPEDEQLEQIIRERNEFERENIELKLDLGEMCEAMIYMFNGGWDDEHQKCIDKEVNRLINKNKQHVSE